MPGLFYANYGVVPITASAPELPAMLALPPSTGSRLRYVLASYSLNGTFLGLEELTHQLQLCTGGARAPSAYLDFGTSMRISCEVPIDELLEVTEPIFYDLYFYYNTDTQGQAQARLNDLTAGYLYPVPVRVNNLRIDGNRVNDNVDREGRPANFDDQLTRRFFTIDAASGVTQAGQMPRVVRYLKTATLTATLRESNGASGQIVSNKILPPLLVVEYGEISVPVESESPRAVAAALAALDPPITAPSTFTAVYTMEMDNSFETINYFFVIAVVFFGLVSIGKAGIFMRRNQSGALDGYAMIRIVAQAADVFATTFFILLLIISLWWLITYKGQTELYMLMPKYGASGDSYQLYLGAAMPFNTFIVVAFVAKVLHILDLLHIQTQHDLYFIDWEQPRSLSKDGDEEAGTTGGTSGPSSTELSSTGRGGKKEKNKGNKERYPLQEAGLIPVSVWRTIFVANEWVKLQDVRAISMEITLIGLLFLMRGLEMEDYARLIPAGMGEVGMPFHTLLRFALSSSLLLSICMVQWLFRWALWERYVKDRIWQFVDLLAVTNVSCLLLEERHFGFYLHGRSVHDHADADMAQLNANLKREEEGLEMLRGFRQESTVQTFEVYLSPRVRQRYDAAFSGALDGPTYNRGRAGRNRRREPGAANPRRRGFRAAPEEGVQRHRELNRFLMQYLGTPTTDGADPTNRGGEGSRPIVRRKGYWEQLVGMPPGGDEISSYRDRSIFLEDASGRFKRLLLAGREWDMVLLAALTYSIIDVFAANTFVAVFGTYAMDVGVRAVRAELATRNIAAKTLLDDRFLL